MLALHDKRGNLGATIGAPAGGRTAARCNARRNTIKTVVRVLELSLAALSACHALRLQHIRAGQIRLALKGHSLLVSYVLPFSSKRAFS